MYKKYDPEISGPGRVMINKTTAMAVDDAEEYARSILAAVQQCREAEADPLAPITTMLDDAVLNDEELAVLEEIVQRRRARLQRTAETE